MGRSGLPGWVDLEEHAQDAWEPVGLYGKSVADPFSACVHTDQVPGGTGVLNLDTVTRDSDQRPHVSRVRCAGSGPEQ